MGGRETRPRRATRRHRARREVATAAAALAAVALVAFVVGVRTGRPSGSPRGDSVDVRVLQDLRYHAEQAVGLSLVLLAKPDSGASTALRQVARDIVTVESEDRGRMAQLLTMFDAPVDTDSDTALTWTGDAVPLNEMPGLAVDDDTTLFAQAAGERADRLYARLLAAHQDAAGTLAARGAELVSRAQVRELLLDMVVHRQDALRQLRAVVPTG